MGTKPKKKRAMRSVKSGVKTAELIKQNQEILNRLANDKVKFTFTEGGTSKIDVDGDHANFIFIRLADT